LEGHESGHESTETVADKCALLKTENPSPAAPHEDLQTDYTASPAVRSLDPVRIWIKAARSAARKQIVRAAVADQIRQYARNLIVRGVSSFNAVDGHVKR
jgi:hypothetical protein